MFDFFFFFFNFILVMFYCYTKIKPEILNYIQSPLITLALLRTGL